MPPLLTIENSLATVSTGYTVFEKDQVLTHDQLNSVADYADDQIRLSRVRLGGVGVACGLGVSLAGGAVRVAGGVGVTTDGDLLYLDADTVYDRWRPYDRSFPAYPLLYHSGDVNGTMHGAWELFPSGAEGSPGRPLGELAAAAGRPLASLHAVLLMESYRQDDDLCSGTDCDNLGARAVNTRKLLLVEPDAVRGLAGGQATPADAYASLPELVAERPVLPSTLTGVAQLAAAYRAACHAIHDRLVAALPLIHQHAGAFLGDAVTAGSAAAWTTRLTAYRGAFATATAGIQYYYDFLKDVVEAYNELREHLFGDDTWCSPPVATFPKHLLLGELAGSTANRTGWYPSPVTSRTAGALEHARFLARRLDALVTRFSVSTSTTLPLRVTPSAGEDRPLDDRAIPFYYTPGGSDPIHRRWSWRLVQRGMEAATYGYHASTYAAAGSAAADPLAFQLGRATFFRVEGVLGKPVQAALDELGSQLRARNLPFTVRAVLLGTDASRVVRPPGRRVTDLHHLHQVIRKDADARLLDAEEFATHYTAEVLRVTDAGQLFHEQEDEQRTLVRSAAASKGPEVTANAAAARVATGGSYTEYRAQSSALQQGMSATIQSAADLSFQVKPVATTGFITPLETLVSGVQTAWLPWFDEILDWKEEKEDTRLLWSAFAEQHPQGEHFGGVTRGGTLVLVHDAAGTVVAELMLPYTWEEEPVDEEEPELTTPRTDPPVVRTPPVRTIPTRKWGFEQEWAVKEPQLTVLTGARQDLEEWVQTQTGLIQDQLTWQTQFLTQDRLAFQNEVMRSVGQTYESVISNSFSYKQAAGTESTRAPATQYQDEKLGLLAGATRTQAEAVILLERLAVDDPAVLEQLEGARQTLVTLVEQTTAHMESAGTVVATGTEGSAAVQEIATGITALQGTPAFDAARASVENATRESSNLSLKVAVTPLFRG